MSRLLLALFLPLILSACTFGPEYTSLSIGNAVAKPRSHEFAFSVKYTKLRDATGINAFPNGGVPKYESREARVYRCNLDRKSVELIASIPDFAGIPQPKAVWIEGWRGDVLYFSLRGYGKAARGGDDLSDQRLLFYRVDAVGRLDSIEELPFDLEREGNSVPLPDPPFLRLSWGDMNIEIAMDSRISANEPQADLSFDPVTEEPRLSTP